MARHLEVIESSEIGLVALVTDGTADRWIPTIDVRTEFEAVDQR